MVTALLAAGCGKGSPEAGSANEVSVEDAVAATVRSPSFVLTSIGVEVTYHAPDRVRQVEHGQSTSSDDGATEVTTITKLFIDDGYYESTNRRGGAPSFTRFGRCTRPDNAAEVILGVLRTAKLSAVRSDGATYSATLDNHGNSVAVTGQLTVANRLVKTVTLGVPGPPRTWTFSDYGKAGPIEAPAATGNGQRSC